MINQWNDSKAASPADPQAGPEITALHHRGRTLAATSKRLFRIPLAVFGFVVIALVVLMAVFADWIAPYNPEAIDVLHMLEGPGWPHLLGTDQLGRDTLSRIIFGSRVALIVSLGSVSLGALIWHPHRPDFRICPGMAGRSHHAFYGCPGLLSQPDSGCGADCRFGQHPVKCDYRYRCG